MPIFAPFILALTFGFNVLISGELFSIFFSPTWVLSLDGGISILLFIFIFGIFPFILVLIILEEDKLFCISKLGDPILILGSFIIFIILSCILSFKFISSLFILFKFIIGLESLIPGILPFKE